MAEKKHKKELMGRIGLEMDDLGFVLEPAQVEVGSGYTVSVSYDENEKPIVDIKTYGEVNMAKLQKEIRKAFPDAKIRNLNNAGTVTIVKKRKKRRKHSV
ncbi:hypothetical protein CW667_01200 [Candidatus Bathyarchaeota archaeon]|nr:MAG: hypothetical protein CW667_01200 [Candidatus Bathyarchaeota archaeon]